MYGAPASPGLRAFNAIMNGDCRVAQQNAVGSFNQNLVASLSGTGAIHQCCDGFAIAFQSPVGPNNVNVFQTAVHPILGINGFSHRIDSIPGVANIPIAAGNSNVIAHAVYVEMLNFGELLEQNCGLQFWARSTLQSGIHYVVFDVGAGGLDNQKFIQRFNIRQVNVWEQFFVPISFSDSILTLPAPETRGRILAVYWPMLVAADRQTANEAFIGAWTVGNSPFFSGVNPPQYGGTGAALQITDVQLTVGAGRVPFYRPEISETLERAKRYFHHTFPYGITPTQGIGNGAGGTGIDGRVKYSALVAAAVRHTVNFRFPVEMILAPTVTYFSPDTLTATWRNETAGADSGAAASDQLSAKAVTIGNPQTAGAVVGDVMTLHAQFDARMS